MVNTFWSQDRKHFKWSCRHRMKKVKAFVEQHLNSNSHPPWTCISANTFMFFCVTILFVFSLWCWLVDGSVVQILWGKRRFGEGTRGFPCGSAVKNLPAMQVMRVRSLGQEDPLEKEMAAHSSILAWKIPWTEELAGYNPRGRKESNTTEWLSMYILYKGRKKNYSF